VAARSARAAGGDAGDWISRRCVAQRIFALYRSVSPRSKESGYVEGQNVAIEYRWAENHYDRLPALAADLVRREVAVIATFDTASSLAAKAATATIPIVFAMGADPVKIGLVTSLARPGGNVTGMSHLINALSSKRLGLLRELVPTATAFGLLVDPTNPNAEPEAADMKEAADLLGHKLVVAKASTASEVDAAFTNLVQQRVDVLAIAAQGFFMGRRSQQLAE
jgi:putative ABC transport system substrate-binding protein